MEEIFSVIGRGVVILPGYPRDRADAPTIRVKDKIQLRRSNGEITETYIAGIEYVSGAKAVKRMLPILLPPYITKAEVQAGTEVWVCPCIV